MAGHNKWSKIKHKKAKEDAKKGKIFTRMGRELQVAARSGGPDPQYNAALRQAMDRAMAENMPNDNIQRAIKRGAGLLPGQEIEEINYEGYAPGGVAVLVSCLSDNRNRTVGEVRHAFAKAGGSLGENGSVAWMFNRVGHIDVVDQQADEETMMDFAIQVGANDVRAGDNDGVWQFICDDSDLGQVRQSLEQAGMMIQDAVFSYEPSNSVEISGSTAVEVFKFIDVLDGLDDVQEVFANYEISDQEFQTIAEQM